MEERAECWGHWQCRACYGEQVKDRLLAVVGGNTEVHRLTCQICGHISHYDLRKRREPTVSLDHAFWWRGASLEHTLLNAPRIASSQ